jgi:hypothetical protein
MKPTFSTAPTGDRLGTAIAARLTEASQLLDHDIAERLRIARQQATARRKVAEFAPAFSLAGIVRSGRTAALQMGGQDAPGPWRWLGATVPLLALVAGLLVIHVVQSDNRASELAEVDAELLTDDLPTTAYTDPGFLQFLRASEATTAN